MTFDSLDVWMSKVQGWIDAAVLMLPNLVAALLILLLFWIAARLLACLTARLLRRTTPFEVPGRLQEQPVELFYEGFGDSSIIFVVRFWIPFRREPDYLVARSEAVKRIKRAFDEQGVTIPFPIRTLDFSQVGGRLLSEELQEARPAG